MIRPSNEAGFLAQYRPEPFSFDPADAPVRLRDLWRRLSAGDDRAALAAARALLREDAITEDTERAALLAATAAAELRAGDPTEAARFAKRSLAAHRNQWMAHRLRIEALEAAQSPVRAHRYAASVDRPEEQPKWDELPELRDFHLFLAALAWRAGAWDAAAERLTAAYPDGPPSMPERLQSDCFRLAFYRGNAADAAAAAGAMLHGASINQIDALLNAMVQQGWTAEALPLYREAYERHDSSELLRRRLVGLCIREGDLDEARALAAGGALNIVV